MRRQHLLAAVQGGDHGTNRRRLTSAPPGGVSPDDGQLVASSVAVGAAVVAFRCHPEPEQPARPARHGVGCTLMRVYWAFNAFQQLIEQFMFQSDNVRAPRTDSFSSSLRSLGEVRLLVNLLADVALPAPSS